MDLTVTQEEYESLVTLARAGATTPEKQRQLDAWLKLIEKKNDITRYQLWVQWQEADSPMPPNTNFPEVWPPEMRALIQQFSRPVSKADVEVLLEKKARKPVTVLVTSDPAATLGWTALDAYFATR
jgi:hypothetical protein